MLDLTKFYQRSALWASVLVAVSFMFVPFLDAHGKDLALKFIACGILICSISIFALLMIVLYKSVKGSKSRK
jgi:hypothetical protein